MRVLVGDDQIDIVEAIRLLLKGAGHQVATACTPEALLTELGQQPVDLVLTDMNYQRDTTSGDEGLELVRRIRTREPGVPVIVMTAWSTVDLAVHAMQHGAVDFIQKPWDNQRLLAVVEKHGRRRMGGSAADAGASKDGGDPHGELEIARTVQQRLFPATSRRQGLETEGICLPAREIGGDYYDFLDLPGGLTGIVLADVSGKGIPAALLMANLQASFRSIASETADVGRILESVNRLFYKSTPVERFATVFFAVVDPVAGVMRYASCGHPPALLLRSSSPRDSEWLEATAMVLGVMESLPVEVREVPIATGDTVVIFTDGVSEAAVDGAVEFFGEARVRRVLEENSSRGIADMVRVLAKEAEEVQRGILHDDLTIAAFRRVA